MTVTEDIAAARQLLERHGYEVIPPFAEDSAGERRADAARDIVAIIAASLRGDREGALTVLEHCEDPYVAAVAVRWLERVVRDMAEADGEDPAVVLAALALRCSGGWPEPGTEGNG